MTAYKIPFRYWGSPLAIAGIILSAGGVSAQDAIDPAEPLVDADKVIYAPAYFERYSANTAAEMVLQIPGFELENESGARGFGQGSGNLLINGMRPTSKNSNVEVQLGRIPASAVKRIELLKNGSPELAGQSGLIVNVITENKASVAGTVEVGAFGANNGFLDATARASLTLGKGNWSYNFEATRWTAGWSGSGYEHLLDRDETVTEVRDETAENKRVGHEVVLGVAWADGAGKAFNLNVKGDRTRYRYEQFTGRFEAVPEFLYGAGLGFLGNVRQETEYGYEISGDYSQPAFGGTVKLIGLRRLEDSRFTYDTHNANADSSFYRFQGTNNPIEKETVLRALYSRNLAAGSVLEFAAEGAVNELSQHSAFEENTGAGFVPVDVSGSNRAVKEKRGEISATGSRKVGQNWLFQGSVAGEYSSISVEGFPDATRSFYRPKGFVSAQYSFDDNSRVWMRLDRRVGQLDLFNFVSAVNIFQETETSGNVDILPDQSWVLELAGEQRLKGGHIIRLGVTYEAIEDFQANVPLAGGGEGPGNLRDTAKRLIAEASMTFMADKWGIPGGRFDIIANVSAISLTDPVTGEKHGEERTDRWLYQIDFRQDIPKTDWAWGGYVRHWHRRGSLRVDQRFTETTRPWIDIFLEHKNIFGTRARLEFSHLPVRFGRLSKRAFYEPDRSGTLTGFEHSQRTFHRTVRVNFTKTF